MPEKGTAAEWNVVSTSAGGAAVNCVKAAAAGVTHVITSVLIYASGAATAGKQAYVVIGGAQVPIAQLPSAATVLLDFGEGLPIAEGAVMQVISDAANGTTVLTGIVSGYSIGA